jgi:hypothetical protein
MFRNAIVGEMRAEQIAGWTLALIACLALAGVFESWAYPVAYEFRCWKPLPAYRYVSGQCCETGWYAPQCESWRNAR